MLRDSIVVNPISTTNEISYTVAQCVPLKRRYTSNRLYGVTSQKLVLFKRIVVSVCFMYIYIGRLGVVDSVVSIATGYGLEYRGVGVRVPVGSRIFSSPHHPDQL
jgi:hypothetical protein